jgi:hypothetical protein
MTQRMQELAGEIVRLQGELDREIAAQRKVLGVKLEAALVDFEDGVVAEQRALRIKVASFLAQSSFGATVTAPIIYSLIIPFLLADIWVVIYQAVYFQACGITRVRRSDYIVFDRRHLAYLNWIEAMNCLFCAYANGLVSYIRQVSSRAEQYWCPIKHALKIHDPHTRYQKFLKCGDADGCRGRLAACRNQLRATEA